MSLFLRIDINIAAALLLAVVLRIAYSRLDRQDILNKKFFNTSWAILAEILFETVTCVINAYPGTFTKWLSIFLHICLFVTAPILTYFWAIFIYSWILPETKTSKQVHMIFLIPAVINFFIVILSPVFGWVFFIDSMNVYHRGPLYIVTAIIAYSYLFYGLIIIAKYRKNIIRHEIIPVITFSILPIVGGISQILFYGVLLMWSSTAFSLIILYVLLEQRMVHLDGLTGAWTRESFESYISQRMRYKAKKKFGAIYLDFDRLKQINDEYGHLEGDQAIRTTIKIIRGLLGKTDILARMGGDEFIIVLDCESKEILDKMVENINAKLQGYNKKSGKKYELECSFGADIFDNGYSGIEQFLNHIDKLMYKNKREKRNN
ncbi:MAG: diguanylate cyclase [Bacillota bacterium]|nr:diguanylate cyclase [Bacillota bacterium]